MTNRVVFRGKIVEVTHDRVELPNGREAELEVIHHPGGAAVVALDADGWVCLLWQYRYAAGGWIWELPAGKLEPNEPPNITAARELEEEAGRQAGQWQSLGQLLSSPGVFNEVIHLYFASELAETPLNHEPHESIEVRWLPFAEALDMARRGEITDGKTVAGLFRASALVNG